MDDSQMLDVKIAFIGWNRLWVVWKNNVHHFFRLLRFAWWTMVRNVIKKHTNSSQSAWITASDKKNERNAAELHWITSTWLKLILLFSVCAPEMIYEIRGERKQYHSAPSRIKNCFFCISICVAMVDWFSRGCINCSYTNDVLNVNNQRSGLSV